MDLQEIIIEKIEQDGSISFRDFMDMCLYYPEKGYYTRSVERVGTRGDFYTSPCLGPLFGAMIARQIEECWMLLGKGPFAIVEYAAGDLSLCRSVMQSLQHNKQLYREISYYLLEKNASPHTPQVVLPEKTKWIRTLAEAGMIRGCILSNELIDNLPIYQVLMKEELMEIRIGCRDGNFVEILEPADKPLRDYFTELGVRLPKDFRTEVNLDAIDWSGEVASGLQQGFVISIDYGFPSEELYADHRRAGNLVCYFRHHPHDCPYQHIGNQDITAHVNFSALHHWGIKNDLQQCGYTTQSHFLTCLGITDFIRHRPSPEVDTSALKNLLYGIGAKMKVFIQQKKMDGTRLSGLRLARMIR